MFFFLISKGNTGDLKKGHPCRRNYNGNFILKHKHGGLVYSAVFLSLFYFNTKCFVVYIA